MSIEQIYQDLVNSFNQVQKEFEAGEFNLYTAKELIELINKKV